MTSNANKLLHCIYVTIDKWRLLLFLVTIEDFKEISNNESHSPIPCPPPPHPTLFGYTLMLFLKGLYHRTPSPWIFFTMFARIWMNLQAHKHKWITQKWRTKFTYESRLHWHKKTGFFSHSGFLLEVARQLPLNTAKNPNWKTHLRSVVFETPPVFTVFFANVNARFPLTGIIWDFGHVGRDFLRNHPRPATYCALRTVKGREKSRMRTTYQKTSMKKKKNVFFGACAFLAKKLKVMGFLAV